MKPLFIYAVTAITHLSRSRICKPLAARVVIFSCFILILTKAQQHSQEDGIYPDPTMTPGSVQETDFNVFCQMGWPSAHRNVTQTTKDDVYSNYGLPDGDYTGYCSQGCEIDHIIPLKLGGANDEANLWPEVYDGQWGAHTKDTLENRMKSLVCCQAMTAEIATNAISSDWIAAYDAYMEQICA